jgi:hypothetical protein
MQLSDASAIARERAIGLALFGIAVLGPWALLVLLIARSKSKRLRVFGLGIVPVLVASFAGMIMTVCWYPGPPGVGALASTGKRRSVPVLAALAEYKKREGAYPYTLASLVPGFLPDSTLPAIDHFLGYPLEYTVSTDRHEFVLQFRYVGPGMNECAWADTSSAWHCGGYF